jgi:hypothetical protein
MSRRSSSSTTMVRRGQPKSIRLRKRILASNLRPKKSVE